eukprot:NODE_142_length_15935_cov_1.439126.p7 type:complete len:286 gc:universal NODE_142_length_15935_cov_1.439126:2861-2004(-)
MIKTIISPQFRYLKKEWTEEMKNQFIVTLDMSNLNLDIVNIAKYSNLKELNLCCNLLSKIDIEWPQNLEILMLNGNYISRIERSLPPNLVVLGLAYNEFTEVPVITTLEKLKYLDIRGNNLSSLDTILLPQGIISLNCSENPISLIFDYESILQQKNEKLRINSKITIAKNIPIQVICFTLKIEGKFLEFIKSIPSSSPTIKLHGDGLQLDLDLDIKEIGFGIKKKQSEFTLRSPSSKDSLVSLYRIVKYYSVIKLLIGTLEYQCRFNEFISLNPDSSILIKISQ